MYVNTYPRPIPTQSLLMPRLYLLHLVYLIARKETHRQMTLAAVGELSANLKKNISFISSLATDIYVGPKYTS